MVRQDEADNLCNDLHRVLDLLALREARVAGTIKISTELRRKLKRVRTDNERFYRLKAGGAEA